MSVVPNLMRTAADTVRKYIQLSLALDFRV